MKTVLPTLELSIRTILNNGNIMLSLRRNEPLLLAAVLAGSAIEQVNYNAF